MMPADIPVFTTNDLLQTIHASVAECYNQAHIIRIKWRKIMARVFSSAQSISIMKIPEPAADSASAIRF